MSDESLPLSRTEIEEIVTNIVQKELNQWKETANHNQRMMEESAARLDDIQRDNAALSRKLGEKVSTIDDLQKKIDALEKSKKDLEIDLNNLEQHGRKCSVRIFGLRVQNQNYPQAVLQLLRERLKLDINMGDIVAAHPLPAKSNNHIPPIIVKFLRPYNQEQVLRVRRNLKGSHIGITEDLTRRNIQLLNRVKSSDNVVDAWTVKGQVWCKLADARKRKMELFQSINVSTNVPQNTQRPVVNPEQVIKSTNVFGRRPMHLTAGPTHSSTPKPPISPRLAMIAVVPTPHTPVHRRNSSSTLSSPSLSLVAINNPASIDNQEQAAGAVGGIAPTSHTPIQHHQSSRPGTPFPSGQPSTSSNRAMPYRRLEDDDTLIMLMESHITMV